MFVPYFHPKRVGVAPCPAVNSTTDTHTHPSTDTGVPMFTLNSDYKFRKDLMTTVFVEQPLEKPVCLLISHKELDLPIIPIPFYKTCVPKTIPSGTEAPFSPK